MCYQNYHTNVSKTFDKLDLPPNKKAFKIFSVMPKHLSKKYVSVCICTCVCQNVSSEIEICIKYIYFLPHNLHSVIQFLQNFSIKNARRWRLVKLLLLLYIWIYKSQHNFTHHSQSSNYEESKLSIPNRLALCFTHIKNLKLYQRGKENLGNERRWK